jgi:hypothetical protein
MLVYANGQTSGLWWRKVLIAAAIAAMAPSAYANMIYSNLGPGNTYFYGAGDTVSGTSATYLGSPIGLSEVAVEFTSNYDFVLGEIDVALSNSNGTNSASLMLCEDSGGVPGTAIESWTVTDLPAFGSTSTELQAVLPTSIVTLLGGQDYWVVAAAITADTYDIWNLDGNGSGAGGLMAQNTGSGWATAELPDSQMAFAVQGEIVPEPGTFWWGFAGVILAGILSRRDYVIQSVKAANRQQAK